MIHINRSSIVTQPNKRIITLSQEALRRTSSASRSTKSVETTNLEDEIVNTVIPNIDGKRIPLFGQDDGHEGLFEIQKQAVKSREYLEEGNTKPDKLSCGRAVICQHHEKGSEREVLGS